MNTSIVNTKLWIQCECNYDYLKWSIDNKKEMLTGAKWNVFKHFVLVYIQKINTYTSSNIYYTRLAIPENQNVLTESMSGEI